MTTEEVIQKVWFRFRIKKSSLLIGILRGDFLFVRRRYERFTQCNKFPPVFCVVQSDLREFAICKKWLFLALLKLCCIYIPLTVNLLTFNIYCMQNCYTVTHYQNKTLYSNVFFGSFLWLFLKISHIRRSHPTFISVN